MDGEGTGTHTPQISITDHRTTGSSERQSPSQEQTSSPAPNNLERTLSNASTTLNDTFSRLQQIRTALSYLEASMVPVDGTSEQPTRQSRTSNTNTESNIRPPHSALVLSEESAPSPLDTESLRQRLDEIAPDLPEYMHATADMIQNMTRSQETVIQSLNSTGSGIIRASGQTAEPTDASNVRVSDRRRARPERDPNAARESNARLFRTEASRDSTPSITLPAWRASTRNEDSASTILGRRVAARVATTRPPDGSQRSRGTLSPSFLRPEGHGPSIIIPRDASRVVIPPRLPDRVSRRIAQFETSASERQRRYDSDGSETEVDNYVYRPMTIWRQHSNGIATSNIRQRRADRDGTSPSLPDIIPMSPLSSPGGLYSTGTSSSESSPRATGRPRSGAVSSGMLHMHGHSNRLPNALSDAPSSIAPTSSTTTDGDNLDGALFSRRRDGQQAGDSLYHEVIDEEEGRTYRIRRRINSDGDEHVYRINSDAWWDDDNFTFTNPFSNSTVPRPDTGSRVQSGTTEGFDALEFYQNTAAASAGNTDITLRERTRRLSWNYANQTQHSDTDLPPLVTRIPSTDPNSSTRRRRGWARLDANGDEIPTDEEEEIERERTAQRLRNSQAAAWRSSNSSSTVRTRLEYFAPTTRSVFSHATDEEDEEEAAVRVRLNLPPRQSTGRFSNARLGILSDARKKEEEEPEEEQEFFGTSEPYFINPLPMPVEEMLSMRSRPSLHTDHTRTVSAQLRAKEFAAC